MSEDVEFDGVEVKLGRTVYIVPPLALGAVKKHVERIQRFGQLTLEEQMDLTIDVTLAALKRNYADMTRERVEDLVDLRNMPQVFQAVMQVSGFTAGQPEGNPQGGTSPSTGQPSTPT